MSATPSKPDYILNADISYISNGHARQNLDLYTPAPSPGRHSSPYPLVIYIHGGAFKYGDKRNNLTPLRLVTDKGYALASINYRLSGDAIFPAAVQDCNAAVSYLRQHSATLNLDPGRFVAMGESAGAYMALMVGLPGPLQPPDFTHPEAADAPSSVVGVVDFYGPTEFLQMDAHGPRDSPHPHDAADSPESLFLGKQITTVPELVGKASPLRYVGEETPPVLIAHGTVDVVVPVHQSYLLEGALREKGREVQVHWVEGTDHVFRGISQEQRAELDRVVDEWLERVMGQ